jgi:hypothetical protein
VAATVGAVDAATKALDPTVIAAAVDAAVDADVESAAQLAHSAQCTHARCTTI